LKPDFLSKMIGGLVLALIDALWASRGGAG
jgi:hypothetical protein